MPLSVVFLLPQNWSRLRPYYQSTNTAAKVKFPRSLRGLEGRKTTTLPFLWFSLGEEDQVSKGELGVDFGARDEGMRSRNQWRDLLQSSAFVSLLRCFKAHIKWLKVQEQFPAVS